MESFGNGLRIGGGAEYLKFLIVLFQGYWMNSLTLFSPDAFNGRAKFNNMDVIKIQ